MSFGEVINLYRDNELKIDPEFQRLFRWDLWQKSRFIESILLGIPVPPIFVFQKEDGTWELIDGLQRLSSILEFCGLLITPEGNKADPSYLEATDILPNLENKSWQVWNEGDSALTKQQQLSIRRTRIRVEILLSESDESAKFELFQRLNTGGSKLTEQEVRNCVAIMLNPELHKLFVQLSESNDFVTTTNQTENAITNQVNVELVLRYFAYRFKPYEGKLDVHPYLDSALLELAKSDTIDFEHEKSVFQKTFSLINSAQGESGFKKWNGEKFSGKFLMSVFETVAFGISSNIEDILKQDNPEEFVISRAKQLWDVIPPLLTIVKNRRFKPLLTTA